MEQLLMCVPAFLVHFIMCGLETHVEVQATVGAEGTACVALSLCGVLCSLVHKNHTESFTLRQNGNCTSPMSLLSCSARASVCKCLCTCMCMHVHAQAREDIYRRGQMSFSVTLHLINRDSSLTWKRAYSAMLAGQQASGIYLGSLLPGLLAYETMLSVL